MRTNALRSDPGQAAQPCAVTDQAVEGGWVWIDVELEAHDTGDDLDALVESLGLDPLAVDDAVADDDHPKLDDFEDHILVVMHGLNDRAVETYEIDCFVTPTSLVTVHRGPSPSIPAFSEHVSRSTELASGGPDELLARLADVVSRRFLALLTLLDRRVDELTAMALAADPDFLGELTALQADAGRVRDILRPQREVFDQLRRSASPLLSDPGRRRFSDVYDLAERSVNEYESARTAMSEALGAYQGAEAREATEVTKVLTVYAAVMLPLSLIAGIFGMNFVELPGTDSDTGWIWVVGAMAVVAVGSLALFAIAGWIRPPSARRAGTALGRGLIEAAKTPAQIVGALYEVSSRPVRHGVARRRSSNGRPTGSAGGVDG